MRVVLVGGGGFIGQRLAAELARRGHHTVVATRDREKVKKDLILLPNTEVVIYNPFVAATLPRVLHGADVIVNLIGVLHEVERNLFDKVHVELVRLLVNGCDRQRPPRLIQVSAMGASTDAPSAYLRSKAKGEEVIRQEQTLRHTIVRPSVVFGEGDSFVNQFAALARRFPVLPLPGSYGVLQPIAVDDLARMIAGVVEDEGYNGKTLLAGGAEVVSLRELVSLVVEALGTRCAVVPLGEFSSRVFAAVVDLLPFVYVFTGDNFNSLRVPSVTPKEGNDAEKILGRLTGLTEGIAQMLASHRGDGQRLRLSARR